MNHSENNDESWARSADVVELLAYMLAFPISDHSAAVKDLVVDDLRNFHAVGLVRASKAIAFEQPR